jgi:phytoene synthase
MQVVDPALQHGYEAARRMLRRHDPTYYLATRRLPAPLRPATYALYGYVRMADQLVDGPRRPPTPDARRAALDAWEGQLQAPSHPIACALDDAAARHALPLEELETYMRSMRVDCEPVRIGSWDELQAYMDGSAGTVGRIMAALLGLPPDHHADLGRLGVAFQLANFIRDVREDRRLDRIYLPAEDRARFGVSDSDLEGTGPAVRALLAHEVERARSLFASARPAIAAAPPSVRPGVRLAVGLYDRMLRQDRPTGVRVWHLPGAALEAIR